MYHKLAWITGIAMLAAVGSAAAQSTGLPTFNAPYRAFERHEFGGTLSFPSGADFAFEGAFGFGHRTFDIGFRGGVLEPKRGDALILAGVTGRQRVLTHTEDFPLDGAIIVGIGGQFVSNGTTLFIPVGLSLGRRLDLEDSQVSIVPYAEPVLFLTAGSNQETDLNFALGLGADFRLSPVFAARVSVGLGDKSLEGFALTAVWIR